MAKKAKKKSKWIKPRHKIITAVAWPFFWLFVLIKYRMAVKKYPDSGRQYLVLMNHQTSSDQFFVGLTFRRPLYYIASEDIFSNGLISTLLKFALNPIPINKSAADMRAIINCIKVKNEGGTIVMAPEGNRTYSGRTCYIKPSVVPLIRKLGLPIAFFRIDGGYGVQPRWTDRNRHGKISVGISRVMEPDAYAELTDEQLYSEIVRELDVNEALPGSYLSDRGAEYIERMLYVCPDCGLSEFRSAGNSFSCLKCGRRYTYTSTKEIIPEKGTSALRFANDFYEYQQSFIRGLDLSQYIGEPAYTDSIRLFSVELCRRKKLLSSDAVMKLYGDRITLSSREAGIDMKLSFADIKSVTLLGRNKMNIRTSEGILQIRGTKRFNPVKYLNFYCHATGGIKENNEFLGL